MGIKRQTAPYLRHPKANVVRMMQDVIIALIPAIIFAVYQFKLSAVIILVLATLTMIGTEALFDKIAKKPIVLYNRSAIISGLIFGLIMPDGSPWWVVIISAFAGMAIAKSMFGGLGNNIFNVAGFARVFAMLSFGGWLEYKVDAISGATALAKLAENPFNKDVLSSFKLTDLLIGNIPGSIGEVSAIAIIIGGAYLLIRKSADWRPIVAFLGMFALMAAGVALVQDAGPWYVVYHLLSGGLLFGVVFMITDPVTSPITGPSRILYGMTVGALTFFIRLFGAYPEGVVFAILIMNMFVPAMDYHKWSTNKFTKRKIMGYTSLAALLIVIAIAGSYTLV